MVMQEFVAQHVVAGNLGWWKMLLVYLPFVPWAWVVATVIDKDSRYFHLNGAMWGGINLGAGAMALACMILIPIFWVGWPVGMIMLAAPILFYVKYRNANVPAHERFSLSETIRLRERLEQRRAAKASRAAALQFRGPKGEERPVPLKEDPLYPIHIMARADGRRGGREGLCIPEGPCRTRDSGTAQAADQHIRRSHAGRAATTDTYDRSVIDRPNHAD
jgi:hypothetical protein